MPVRAKREHALMFPLMFLDSPACFNTVSGDLDRPSPSKSRQANLRLAGIPQCPFGVQDLPINTGVKRDNT